MFSISSFAGHPCSRSNLHDGSAPHAVLPRNKERRHRLHRPPDRQAEAGLHAVRPLRRTTHRGGLQDRLQQGESSLSVGIGFFKSKKHLFIVRIVPLSLTYVVLFPPFQLVGVTTIAINVKQSITDTAPAAGAKPTRTYSKCPWSVKSSVNKATRTTQVREASRSPPRSLPTNWRAPSNTDRSRSRA